MRLNGFRLQQAIRAAQQERDLAATRFKPSLMAFPDEDKPSPVSIAETYAEAEQRVAKLQEVQGRFNLTVQVTVLGDEMSLLEAIKRVGGAGRLEKMWRDAAADQTDRYAYSSQTRDADSVVAKRTISFDDANDLRRKTSRYAAALRNAIQNGNAQELDLDVDLPNDWFNT